MLSIQIDTKNPKSLELVFRHRLNIIKLSFFTSHMKRSLIDPVGLLDTLEYEFGKKTLTLIISCFSCRRSRSAHHAPNNRSGISGGNVVVKSCENVYESNVNTCPVII